MSEFTQADAEALDMLMDAFMDHTQGRWTSEEGALYERAKSLRARIATKLTQPESNDASDTSRNTKSHDEYTRAPESREPKK